MRILALALLGWCSVPPQETKPPAIADFTADVQFAHGRPMGGRWQAFVCELQNRTTRELDLQIRIEHDALQATATRRERLAQGARKRLFLYLPSAGRGGYAWSIPPQFRVADASGKGVTGAVPTRQVGWEDNAYMLGVLSGDKGSDRDFGLPRQVNGIETHASRLTPATFPDRWIGLAGLDALLVHDAPLDELTAEQARALADYARQGGTVILSPGPVKGWLNHPAIAAFVKIRSRDPQRITDLPKLTTHHGRFRHSEPFLFHPVENGREVEGLDAGREIVRFDSGYGRTILLPFDLRRAPFDTWPGLEPLWMDLVGRLPRSFAEDGSSLLPTAQASNRVSVFTLMARMINPYPSFMLLLGLATLFVLGVGPFNYYFLRRMRMTLLLVVTVPAISLLFLGGVLGLGYLIKGTATVTHSARFLSTREGMDAARETQLFSLFSPTTRPYDVSFEPGTFGLPADRLYGEDRRFDQRQTMSNLECENGAGLTFRNVGVGQWQSWNVEARAVRDLGKGVSFDATGTGLRITNGTPYTIERGVFLQVGHGGFSTAFGEVGPGRALETPLTSGQYLPLEALGFGEESFGARLLGPWLESLKELRKENLDLRRQKKLLLCLLREDAPPIRPNARTSGRSRGFTLLHVLEEGAP